MSSNFTNTGNFLPSSRSFPEDDTPQLSYEVNKAYVDIATQVNARTSGIYAEDTNVNTGNTWYLNDETVQSRRKVLRFFEDGTFPHGIVNLIRTFSIYGSFRDTDGVFYPLPFVSIPANESVRVEVTATDYIISSVSFTPAIDEGFLVIEFQN